MSHSSPENADTIRPFIESALRWYASEDGRGQNLLTFHETAELITGRLIEALRIRTSDEMVETACAAYAKATDYYVEFHRGLSSASADRMRVGMRAALSAFTSPEHQSAPAYAAAHNSGEGDPSVMPDYVGADTAIQPQRMPEVLFCDWLRGYFEGLAGKDELTAKEANTIRNTLNALTRPECGDAT